MRSLTSGFLGFCLAVGLGCTDQSGPMPKEDQPEVEVVLTVPAGATSFEIIDLVRKSDFLTGELDPDPQKRGGLHQAITQLRPAPVAPRFSR